MQKFKRLVKVKEEFTLIIFNKSISLFRIEQADWKILSKYNF